jgi:hypothetical protein
VLRLLFVALARLHQSPIAAGDVIDIGDCGVTAVLRFLAVQPGKVLDFFLAEIALGIERRNLSALLAKLGGKLPGSLAIEVSVNEPG